MGITRSPLFWIKDEGRFFFKRAFLAEIETYFHKIFKRVQKSFLNIIAVDMNVEEEFSVFGSLRRGAMFAAQNVNIPKEIIEANN